MKTEQLNRMQGGWFIGNFEPSLLKTNDVEVAVKTYKKGNREAAHYHKIAKEFTAVITGKVKMFDREFKAGDIVVTEPMEHTSFEALEDTICTVVKFPGANYDKYLWEEE